MGGKIMGIGVGLFLIAVGAILTFAISDPISGVDLGMVGVILMIVGALGLVLSLLFWSSFSPYRRRRERIVDRNVAPGEREIDRETY
jgi:hypothetical protein